MSEVASSAGVTLRFLVLDFTSGLPVRAPTAKRAIWGLASVSLNNQYFNSRSGRNEKRAKSYVKSPFTVARVARVVRVVHVVGVVHVARVVRVVRVVRDVVSVLFVILVVAHVAHQVGSLIMCEDETFIQAAVLSPEQAPGLLGSFKRKDRDVMLKKDIVATTDNNLTVYTKKLWQTVRLND